MEYGLLIALLIIFYILFRNKKVSPTTKMLKWLRDDKYYLLNNIHISHGDKPDHIVVSEYGIFIINSQECEGDIYGEEHSYQWTVKTRGHSQPITNPVRKTTEAAQVLQSQLQLPKNIFIPIVVYPLTAGIYTQTETTVIYTSKLLSYIRSFQTPVLTTQEAMEIYNELLPLNNSTNPHYIGICPYCGGVLIYNNKIQCKVCKEVFNETKNNIADIIN